ncbi:MAG TPA: NAD(+)/NADH kinase [Polyangiaceae bacterium]|nr:NAD(+)/NADH kinase [Polyangiaceae bacterium]
MSAPRVIVVVKRTPYDRYIEEENDPEVKRLLKRRDPSVSSWLKAHRAHVATLRRVESVLKRLGARVWVLHGPRLVFDASDAKLIVTVGGDGTLLAASHHVGSTPILGVNSSPHSSFGFFCAAQRSTVEPMLRRALDGDLPALTLARMKVDVNGRVVSRRVLNEALFCHEVPAAASRYMIRHGRRQEAQISSGCWVGTASGSTGALRSAGGVVLPLTSQQLELVVREPFGGAETPYDMTRLVVEPGSDVAIVNKMREARLFLDGPFQHVDVRIGERVTFAVSEEPVHVLGLTERRGRNEGPVVAPRGTRTRRTPRTTKKRAR